MPFLLAGCGAAPSSSADESGGIRFAQSSGVIPADPEATYVINLLFLAESSDAIWEQTPMVLVDVPALQVEGVEVVRGDETAWGVLGNLSTTVRATGETGELTSIRLGSQSATSDEIAIGRWDVAPPVEQLDFTSEEYPVATPGCHALPEMDPVPISPRSGVQAVEVRSVTDGATLIAGTTGESGAGLEFTIGCEDTYDLYALQPEVTTESGVGWLPQILVGTGNIDDVLLERISQRPAVAFPSE